MTVSERVAYLKGLMEGLKLDKAGTEGMLFAAVVDTLDAISRELEEIEESAETLNDEVDAISEDLEDVEDLVFGDDEDEEDDDEDDEGSGCPGCCAAKDDGDFVYEVKCPACDCEFTVDEDALTLGVVVCPQCGEPKSEFKPVE